MKIYSVYLSEDGLMLDVFTNVKALYEYIKRLDYSQDVIHVNGKQRKFNYKSLCDALKNDEYYAFAEIGDKDFTSSIIVKEHRVNRK